VARHFRNWRGEIVAEARIRLDILLPDHTTTKVISEAASENLKGLAFFQPGKGLAGSLLPLRGEKPVIPGFLASGKIS